MWPRYLYPDSTVMPGAVNPDAARFLTVLDASLPPD
jgi:hypothetical protein